MVKLKSLMVPELDDSIAEISFLNHFLIKRNHKKVACIITAIGKNGQKIESKLHHIEEPRVYVFTLTGMVEEPVRNAAEIGQLSGVSRKCQSRLVS